MSITQVEDSKGKSLDLIYLGCPDSGVVVEVFRNFGELKIHGLC